MEQSLTGRIAVVTGGGRDLGREIALTLARYGADVAIVGRTLANLERTAQDIREMGRQALAVPADLTDETDIINIFARIGSVLGPVHILVNNASAARMPRPVSDMPLDEWNLTQSTKLTAAMLCSREALKMMIPLNRGSIIHISGTTGVRASAFMSAHSVSQGGLILLGQAMALEVGRHQIRVNTVVPSAIQGDSLNEIVADPTRLELNIDPLAQLKSLSPLGRLVQESEVAAMVCFLVSDYASGVTGQAINILLDQKRPDGNFADAVS